MKAIKEILENYEEEYQTFLDDRFGVRLCQFLTIEEMEALGFVYNDPEKAKAHEPKEWTEENILAQLKEDVEFGWEKACDERSISSNLMYMVVKTWCKVLENEFADFDDYAPYGKPLFEVVAEQYGWELQNG